MKQLIIIGFFFLFFVGCSSAKESTTEIEKKPTPNQEIKQSQEKKNTLENVEEDFKKEAIEINFDDVNGGKYNKGTIVKITGTITSFEDKTAEIEPIFTLSSKEGNTFGLYKIKLIQSNIKVTPYEITLANGTTLSYSTNVVVYGTYDGQDEYGVPHISSPIVEMK